MEIHNTGRRSTGFGMETNMEESKGRDAKECKKDKNLTNRKSHKVRYPGSKKSFTVDAEDIATKSSMKQDRGSRLEV